MPVLMSTLEMQELAARLAKMRLWRAKWTAYGMDKQSHYDMWRVAVGSTGEYHTRLTLPNKGLRITFVERKEQKGQANDRGLVRVKYRYVEARVEPLPAPEPPPQTPEYLRVT
jgi:hypothetical protein